ncbi:MAG: clostripain-related cysteine peptidase, partial [Elusimicrobiota bacterium]|nr:clostripain-related cysteine peptidase [Elusimicrobiota bacterium]
IALVAVFTFTAVNSNAQDFNVDFENSIYNIDMRDLGDINVPKPNTSKIWGPFEHPQKKDIKEWTIMTFINGKNNLEIAGLFNVNQMEAIGSDKNMNIVVELGRMKGQAGDVDIDGDWTGSRRLYVMKDNDEEKVTSPVMMETKDVDMGDYKRIVDFVKWTKKNYPAKKYMLVIWNHGTGMFDPAQEKKFADKGISYDDETGNYVRTVEIGKILKESGGVDILDFDACLMQMAEVAYEVKDYTEVVIGAEETFPGYGQPYDIFLGELKKMPDASPENFAAVIVESAKTFYTTVVSKSMTLSAIRTSKLEGLANKMSAFADSVKKVNDVGAISMARNYTLRYDAVGAGSDPEKTISFFGDISHFASLMSTNITKKGADADKLAAASKDLVEFIANDLVVHSVTVGNDRMGTSLAIGKGISVYLPPAETRITQDKLESIFEGKYQDFAFAKASGWHDFVTFLYNVKAESKCVEPGEGASYRDKLQYRTCKNREKFELGLTKCFDPGEDASMDEIVDYAACKTIEELGL